MITPCCGEDGSKACLFDDEGYLRTNKTLEARSQTTVIVIISHDGNLVGPSTSVSSVGRLWVADVDAEALRAESNRSVQDAVSSHLYSARGRRK
jgi:hypothetical protein